MMSKAVTLLFSLLALGCHGRHLKGPSSTPATSFTSSESSKSSSTASDSESSYFGWPEQLQQQLQELQTVTGAGGSGDFELPPLPSVEDATEWLTGLLGGLATEAGEDHQMLLDMESDALSDDLKDASPTSDLDQWLREVKFILPDGKIPEVKKNFKFGFLTATVHLKVGQLVCQDVQIGGLDPTEVQTQPDKWGLQLSKTAWKCQGKVHYWTSGGLMKLSGDADAEVSASDSSVASTLAFNSSDEGANRLPDSLLLESCQSQLKAKLKLLGGSAWTQIAKLIPGAEGSLSDLVATQLDQLACHEIARLILEEANIGLKAAHDAAKAWLNVPAPSMPEGNDSFVMWGDLPEVQWTERLSALLMESKFYSNIFQKFFTSGTICMLGQGCLLGSKKQFCLLGGEDDADCLVKHNFYGGDKPAVLRVTATAAEVKPQEPGANLGASNESNFLTFAAATERSQVEVTMNLNFTGWAGGAQAKDMGGDIVFRFAMDGSKLSVAVLAKFDKTTFQEVPAFRRYRALGCVADSYSDMEVLDILFDGSLTSTELGVSPQENSSSALGRGSIAVTNTVIQTLFRSYGSMAMPLLQGALRTNLLADATTMLRSWSQSQANAPCPKALGEETKGLGDRPLIDPDMAKVFIIIAWVLAAFSIILMILTSGLKICGRQIGFLETAAEPMLPMASTGSQTSGSSHGSSHSRRLQGGLKKLTEGSLCQSLPVVPKPLRWGMPWMILALVFFVIGSNYMQMASTFLEVSVDDDSSVDVPVYQVMVYSLFYSIHELRRVKLGFLANVVLLFSGVVPYTKLGLMFLAWVVPKKLFGWKQRGRVLLWLDMIGKFSLVDVFVIEFISAALATDINVNKVFPTDEPSSPSSEISVLLRTSQSVGFSSFVLATVGSLIIGHISLYYHGKTKEEVKAPALQPQQRRHDVPPTPVPEPVETTRCGECCTRFRDECGGLFSDCKRFFGQLFSRYTCCSRCSRCITQCCSRCGNRLRHPCGNRCSNRGNASTCPRRFQCCRSERAKSLLSDAIAPLLFVTAVLVTCGGFLTAFTVELHTPFGSMGEKSHSFFGLAGRLAFCTPDPSSVTTIFGQVTYIMFAIVFVLLHLGILLVFWAGKVPPEKLVQTRTAARTLLAWSALDVVVLSMIITLLELSTSNFLFLNGASRRWVETMTGHDPGNQGLDVHITLGPGTYILSAAALAHYFVSYVVMDKLNVATEEHLKNPSSRQVRFATDGLTHTEMANSRF